MTATTPPFSGEGRSPETASHKATKAQGYIITMKWQPHEAYTVRATDTIAADELRLLIERIERLEEEKKGIADDINDVYTEAKSRGYDNKIVRMIVRLRKMEKHDLQEQDAVLDTYRTALNL